MSRTVGQKFGQIPMLSRDELATVSRISAAKTQKAGDSTAGGRYLLETSSLLSAWVNTSVGWSCLPETYIVSASVLTFFTTRQIGSKIETPKRINHKL